MKRIAVIMLLFMFLVACAPTQTEVPKEAAPVSAGDIKIGVSLPLTGEAASLGLDVQAGIDLAVKEVNDAGGVNGKKFTVVYEDDKCSNLGATTAQKLVSVDNVDAMIGPICSSAGGPGLPVVQESGTPAIIFASAPHLTKIGDAIFRIYPSDAFAGKFMAEYVFTTLDKKTAAVVYVKNDWGQGIHDTFVKAFTDLGGKVVLDESLAQDEKDAKTVITKLVRAKPDAVIAPLYPATGVAFLKQAKELGVKAPILGGDAWSTDEVVKSGFADGARIVVAHLSAPDEFKAQIKQTLGKDSTTWAPLGYDAVKIFAQVMSKTGTDKKAVRDELAKVSYAGISTPNIAFDAEGDLLSVQYDVLVIQNGTTSVLQ